MNSTSEGVLVRFLKGRIPLSTSFWLAFVPVYVVLLIGARPIGAWWGGLAADFDLPLLFPMFVMFLIGLVVALGAGRPPLPANLPRGQEDIDAAAGAEVEHRFTRL